MQDVYSLRLLELYEKKNELECDLDLQFLWQLINYYNEYYAFDFESDMGKKFLERIDILMNYPVVFEYFECVNDINDILSKIRDNGIETVDMSLRRFMKIKYV